MPEGPRPQRPGLPGGLMVELRRGAEIAELLPALARLRVTVFREYPYLYQGSASYEERYLAPFAREPQALVVLVRDPAAPPDEQVVGASTALPLAGEQAALRAPFGRGGEEVWYLSESVLLPGYRGRGLGARFFAERERRGRELGYGLAAFCAVERPADHPRRPPGHRPLDAFWQRQGYTRRPQLSAQLPWQDLDEAEESPKQMVFWTKRLSYGFRKETESG